MKKGKRLLSLLMVMLMVLSAFQVGLSAFAEESEVTLKPINYTIIERPAVTLTATDVTRVAAAVNSQEAGNVIVKSTPSGVPELTGSYVSAAYAGETPQATAISMTTDVLVTGVSATCKNNATVTLSDPTLVGKTYKWIVTGGTANAGDVLVFEVTYQYKDKTYKSYACSYVEGISQFAGTSVYTENYRQKAYDFHRYFATVKYTARIMGKGVYGSVTDNNATIGYYNAATDAFVETGSSAGYNTYKFEETGNKNEDKTWNLSNAVAAEIYIDKSVTSTLSDINLRVAMHFGDMGRDHTNINSSYDLLNIFAKNGVASADATSASDVSAESALNLGSNKTTSGIGIDGEVVVPFLGNGFTDGAVYSIVPSLYSKTDADKTSKNYTKCPITLKFHVVDKSALRQQVEYVLSTDPANDYWNNIGKGSNPQSWYYQSGMTDFYNALINAYQILYNPKITQAEIDAAKQSLESAYGNLTLKTADYSAVAALQIQAESYFENAENYSADSVALLTQAYQQVKSDCSVLYQGAVDTMAENLQTAISNMQLLPGDYTKVTEAVSNANKLVPEYYSNYSFVADAVSAVEYGLDITRQSDIDNMAKDINDAIAALIELPADYSIVNPIKQAAIEFMASNGKYYTTESGNAVRAAINAVRTGYLISQQSIVDGWGQAILDARAALVPKPATLTPLTNALNRIPPLPSDQYDRTLYLDWMNYYTDCTAYSKRTDLNIFNNDEISAMATTLNAKYDALIAGPANPVESKLDALRAIVETPLQYQADYYTDTSYAVYTQAIQAAQALLARTDLTEADIPTIEQAGTAINDAITALELKPADYGRLEDARMDAHMYQESTVTVKTLNFVGESLFLGEEVKSYFDVDAPVYVELVAYLAGITPTPYYTIVDQQIVDEMAATINDMIDNLVPAAYTEYLELAKQIYQDDYSSGNYDTTTQAWHEYQMLMEAIASLPLEQSQTTINRFVYEFYNARAAVTGSVEITPTPGSTTVIDEEKGFIYGLAEGVTSLDGYVDVAGGELRYNPTSGGFGTGSTVDLVVGGEVVKTYTIVIFGDVSGDGVVDAFDQTLITSVSNFESQFDIGSAYELAGDVNGDGVVDAFDLSIITSAVNFELSISQTGAVS